MNKSIQAFALASAALFTSVAVQAIEDTAVMPGGEGDSRSIYLYVEKMPSVNLSGSVFEQPIMPSMESLANMEPTELGEMYIKSSAGMCELSITTENDFALKHMYTIMDDGTGMMPGEILAEYALNFTTANGMMARFDNQDIAPKPIDCQSNSGMSVGGLLSLEPFNYNEQAPAGSYGDVVRVHVEVAG